MFSEEEAHQFPPSRPWDHAIELKEGMPKAIDCKVYPTTLTEDEALKNFIQEQLKKGYISKSKLPYACYVRVERSARLELVGYDQVSLPVASEASASGTQ